MLFIVFPYPCHIVIGVAVTAPVGAAVERTNVAAIYAMATLAQSIVFNLFNLAAVRPALCFNRGAT